MSQQRDTSFNWWKDAMFPRFALYGFLKNLRFFEPFFILFLRDAGMSFTLIGTLYAIRDTATYLLEVPTGVFADAIGRRKAMLMAFGAYLISFGVFFWGHGFWWFALAMVLFAFGEAFRSGTHKALILEYLNIHNLTHLKVSYYGRTRAASQFGSAINALIAAALTFYTGSYRIMFLAAAVPYVLDFFNLLSYPKELDGELAELRWDKLGEQARTTARAFVSMFKNPGAARAILNSATLMALFKATKDYLQPILERMALALPIFLAYSGEQRSAVVIGVLPHLFEHQLRFSQRRPLQPPLPRFGAGDQCLVFVGRRHVDAGGDSHLDERDAVGSGGFLGLLHPAQRAAAHERLLRQRPNREPGHGFGAFGGIGGADAVGLGHGCAAGVDG